jgi:hypothetical protein
LILVDQRSTLKFTQFGQTKDGMGGTNMPIIKQMEARECAT